MDEIIKNPPKKVAMLTAGGLAPCLSSCVASLIETYYQLLPETEVYCYLNGFRALPISDKIRVTPEMARIAHKLHYIGGSPIGNSRISLDNAEDCYQRNLVPRGQNPWHVACDALVRDGIEVIHPIGGDGTSIGASNLAKISQKRHKGYSLAVIGLPKTIDNDIIPIKQSLGAHTAAKEGANFFLNVVGENSASKRVLLVHELMGRNCGYLAAETARMYRKKLNDLEFLTGNDYKRDVHAIYLPEMELNFEQEIIRLSNLMDSIGCVNIFVSEGACVNLIIKEILKQGKDVEKDATGNVKLSNLKVGQWIADNFGPKLKAGKSVVVKSGYFCRAAAADEYDRDLIKRCCEVAVKESIKKTSGIVGLSEETNKIELIQLDKIKGGRKFDIKTKWFDEMLKEIGQVDSFRLRKIHKSFYRKQLFIEKDKLQNELCASNELNFAFSHSALLPTSETEDYNFKVILEKYCDESFDAKSKKSLKEILLSLSLAFKYLESQINKAGVLKNDNDKINNLKTLKLVAEENLEKNLKSISSVNLLIFKDKETNNQNYNKTNQNLKFSQTQKFDVFCNPLDGLSNVEANLTIGSLFGVYKSNSKSKTCREQDLYKKGSELVFSGYFFFGAASFLVIAIGNNVIGFKLNPSEKKFEIYNENIVIPKTGIFYSANTAYYNQWIPSVKKFTNYCSKQNKKLRYIGSMVGDIHRTLIYGGIFFYPSNKNNPSGKLKLTTEANLVAFLLEAAGGMASDGQNRIIEKIPMKLDERTPFFGGSIDCVNMVESFHAKY